MEDASKRIAIIGSGPAGFTAALYASRANLDVMVFEGDRPGGQLTITTDVENYPGFPDGIMGPEMMEVFRKQVHRFGAKSIYETITSLEYGEPFTLVSDRGTRYQADAVIVATGASAKLLGAPGEDEYMGYGISACATCDGFFFREKDVLVVGGGDTAMEEALFLTKHCKSVTIVNRTQNFRASKIMLQRAQKNAKISFLLDTVIDEFVGTTENKIKNLTSVKMRNTANGEQWVKEIDGVFIGIGHRPNTDLFAGKLDMDEVGYIKTKADCSYTNVPGVFACGDAQDAVYRQAVTAAGSGCMAAIDAERWLEQQAHAD